MKKVIRFNEGHLLEGKRVTIDGQVCPPCNAVDSMCIIEGSDVKVLGKPLHAPDITEEHSCTISVTYTTAVNFGCFQVSSDNLFIDFYDPTLRWVMVPGAVLRLEGLLKIEKRHFRFSTHSRIRLLTRVNSPCKKRPMYAGTFESYTGTISRVVSGDCVLTDCNTLMICTQFSHAFAIGQSIIVFNAMAIQDPTGIDLVVSLACPPHSHMFLSSKGRKTLPCPFINDVTAKVPLYLALRQLKRKFPKVSTKSWVSRLETMVIQNDNSQESQGYGVPMLDAIVDIFNKSPRRLGTSLILGYLQCSTDCVLKLVDSSLSAILLVSSYSSHIQDAVNSKNHIICLNLGAVSKAVRSATLDYVILTVDLRAARVILVSPKVVPSLDVQPQSGKTYVFNIDVFDEDTLFIHEEACMIPILVVVDLQTCERLLIIPPRWKWIISFLFVHANAFQFKACLLQSGHDFLFLGPGIDIIPDPLAEPLVEITRALANSTTLQDFKSLGESSDSFEGIVVSAYVAQVDPRLAAAISVSLDKVPMLMLQLELRSDSGLHDSVFAYYLAPEPMVKWYGQLIGVGSVLALYSFERIPLQNTIALVGTSTIASIMMSSALSSTPSKPRYLREWKPTLIEFTRHLIRFRVVGLLGNNKLLIEDCTSQAILHIKPGSWIVSPKYYSACVFQRHLDNPKPFSDMALFGRSRLSIVRPPLLELQVVWICPSDSSSALAQHLYHMNLGNHEST